MIQHIVLFRFSDDLSESQKYDLLVALKPLFEGLTEEIDVLRELHIRPNVNPHEPFDFCLDARLDRFEDVSKYATHPAHVALVNEYIKPHVIARACVDVML